MQGDQTEVPVKVQVKDNEGLENNALVTVTFKRQTDKTY